MITLSDNLIENYVDFIAGAVSAFLPIIGMTAGLFLAFAIFDRVVRIIIKAAK